MPFLGQSGISRIRAFSSCISPPLDTKAAIASRRRDHRDVQPLHARERRTSPHDRDEIRDVLLVPLDDDLHRAVGLVRDVSRQFETAGRSLDEVAESNPLYPA